MLYGCCSAVFLIQIIFESRGSAALDVLLKNYFSVSVWFRCDGSALGSRSDLVCNELLKWLLMDPEGDASFEAKQRRAASEDFNCEVDWFVLVIKSHFHSIPEWFTLYGFIWISCLFKSVSSAWKTSSCFSRSRINIITTITQRKEQAIARLVPDSRFHSYTGDSLVLKLFCSLSTSFLVFYHLLMDISDSNWTSCIWSCRKTHTCDIFYFN